MNEQPVGVKPFQYSTIDSFDPVVVAIKLSVKAAFVLAAAYALGLAIVLWSVRAFLLVGMVLPDSEMIIVGMVQEYLGVLLSGFRLWLAGLVPASIIGVVGGSMIGWLFPLLKQSLPFSRALFYSGVISLLPTGILFAIGLIIQPLVDISFHLFIWVGWYGPVTISFFGLWWTAYQVNRKFPFPLR